MKRYILILMACVTMLAIPAKASASTGGAEKAVQREICFDYECGKRFDIWNISVDCNAKGRGTYTCSIYALQGGVDYNLIRGKARVTKYGKRYIVDYRLHW